MVPLVVHWNMNPEIFRIGGFAVRWYGLLFVSGFILGYWIFTKFFEREKLDKAILDPLLYTLLFGTLVGARLGHCLFYGFRYYFCTWEGFLEIFRVWEGGLASHGGALMLLLCMWWFARKYGRKNHIDFIWILKHPTQIYESLTYLVLGLVLVWLYVKKLDSMYRGSFIGIFFIGCFGMRFIIEYVKDYEPVLWNLHMGQVLSIPFILLGIFFLVYAHVKKIPARAVIPDNRTRKAEPTHFAKSLKG